MNRTIYFNYIEEKLNILRYRIESRGKLNVLDLNIHSETFFENLLNLLFGFKLINLNNIFQNIEGIDLIDNENKIVVQVSATCDKNKIENSLNKKIYEQYQGYYYKFISISKEASSNLKKQEFKNPYNMIFDPNNDIIDIKFILRTICGLEINKQRKVYDFIKKELGSEVNNSKIDSNLATIINILAEKKFVVGTDSVETIPFEIEKKIDFNNLKNIKEIIDDYKIFYHKIDEIYSEFDREGQNKSMSVLQEIRRQYIKLKTEENSADRIFYKIIEGIIDIIKNSKNYIEIPIEELQMCADMLVVDTFIRCKIFNNPEGYENVITR